MILLVHFLLSTGAVYSLIPVIVILALIAAGAGLRNRQDILAVLGVGTILGLSGGPGESKGVGALKGFKYDQKKRKLSAISSLFKNRKPIPLKLQEKQQKPDTPPPELPKPKKPDTPPPEKPKPAGKKTTAFGGETTQLVQGATGPLQANRTTKLNGKPTVTLQPQPTNLSPPPPPTPPNQNAVQIPVQARRSFLPSWSTSFGIAAKAGVVAGFILFPYAVPFAYMSFNAASSTKAAYLKIRYRDTKMNRIRSALNEKGHGPLTKRESRQNLRESRRKYKEIVAFMAEQLKGYHSVNAITNSSHPDEIRSNIITKGNIATASFYSRGSLSFRSNRGKPSEAMQRESELLTVTEYMRNHYLYRMKEKLDKGTSVQWVPEPADFKREFSQNLEAAKNISQGITAGKNKNFKNWYLEMHSAFISKMRPQQLETVRATIEAHSSDTKYGIAAHRYKESKSLMGRLAAQGVSEREAVSHIETLKNRGIITEKFYVPGSNLYYKIALNRPRSTAAPPPKPPNASQSTSAPPPKPSAQSQSQAGGDDN